MNWVNKLLPPKIKRADGQRKSALPEGLWCKCPNCEAVLYTADLEANMQVCPKCEHHHRVKARARLDMLMDAHGRKEIGAEVRPKDALKFVDSRPYPVRVEEAQKQTSETDSLVVMQGTIEAEPAVVACFEFEFMGGSMGSVLGERFVRGVRAAIENKCGFVCITASGGARMQEGLFSLMQMAKTTASISELARHGLPFITVLTDPTMGGVSASFAFVGDVVIAEPNALVGFAGPRVIEQTVREKLPEGFQRAEFLLDKGAIDMIVHRKSLRDELSSLLRILRKEPVSS
ncbi:MAG: acetyl-coenzyme carboxylase carboxyl transferase subunit beta [Pseudomonadota bacterium]|jgi:acetyl-CoA carboxylase carboxyl transferase subunit beta